MTHTSTQILVDKTSLSRIGASSDGGVGSVGGRDGGGGIAASHAGCYSTNHNDNDGETAEHRGFLGDSYPIYSSKGYCKGCCTVGEQAGGVRGLHWPGRPPAKRDGEGPREGVGPVGRDPTWARQDGDDSCDPPPPCRLSSIAKGKRSYIASIAIVKLFLVRGPEFKGLAFKTYSFRSVLLTRNHG